MSDPVQQKDQPEQQEEVNVFKIVEAVNARQEPFIAFEYFPPRTPEGVKNLYDRIGRMKAHDPLYVDVTWGAGGSTSDLTMELCVESQKKYGVCANMHLTCTNMARELLDSALEQAEKENVINILALRGDPPAGQEDWKPVDSGFSNALDLVKFIKSTSGDKFSISVAGYPEGHPNNIKPVKEGQELSEAEQGRLVTMDSGERFVCSDADYQVELAYLKEKVDAGAGMVVTQMFYDVDCYLSFVKACQGVGINVPIVPGIMCITSYGGFKRMIGFCKTRVPTSVSERMESIKDDADAVKAYGVEFGIEMCQTLMANAVPGLHFYTLNLEKVVNGILEGLKMGSYATADADAVPLADAAVPLSGAVAEVAAAVSDTVAQGASMAAAVVEGVVESVRATTAAALEPTA